MSLSDQLEAHFSDWCARASIAPHHFHEDGIINEPLWKRAPVKVCFLMKEPNNPPKDEAHRKFDFRVEWDRQLKYTFAKRIALWAAGIHNGFPLPDTIHWKQKHLALRSSALVNVKKTGGRGSSNVHELLTYVQRDRDLILEQLRIIAPEVIILGLSDPPILRDLLFPDVIWHRSGYDITVGAWNGAKLIDFYHPSSHNAPSASYCLLEKVMGCEAYRSLVGS